ncbi:MAG: serine/threonine-protein kinase [Zavarzinella sp.]
MTSDDKDQPLQVSNSQLFTKTSELEQAKSPAQNPQQDDELAFLSPPQAEGEIGRLGNYAVHRKLGQGGMGLVLEAEDLLLKRRVALKVMKPEIATKESQRLRFIREAQAAAAVEHDHICPIFQVGLENGVPYIAMPFLKGDPLDAYFKMRKPLPMYEVVQIGREVAEGLAAAHRAGLVHRDIKPGNIWLEQLADGRTRVRILDFGLARSVKEDVGLTQAGAIIGTPAYMAPEQARSKPLDHRCDLFSLGVMLYELSVGKRPFSGSVILFRY